MKCHAGSGAINNDNKFDWSQALLIHSARRALNPLRKF